uniref:Uncharacterized protein n=1 Tax=Globodera pallida TaxID=36090 RepID=A0A183BQP9_GLOPA
MTKIVFFLVVFCICIILLNNLVAAGSCLSSGTERAATSAGISAKNMRVAENHCNGYDQAADHPKSEIRYPVFFPIRNPIREILGNPIRNPDK